MHGVREYHRGNVWLGSPHRHGPTWPIRPTTPACLAAPGVPSPTGPMWKSPRILGLSVTYTLTTSPGGWFPFTFRSPIGFCSPLPPSRPRGPGTRGTLRASARCRSCSAGQRRASSLPGWARRGKNGHGLDYRRWCVSSVADLPGKVREDLAPLLKRSIGRHASRFTVFSAARQRDSRLQLASLLYARDSPVVDHELDRKSTRLNS